MTCRDLDQLLLSQATGPLSPEAQRHAGECPRCSELLRVVAADDGASELRPALADGIASRLAAGLEVVRPLPSAGYLAAAFALIFAVLGGLIGFGLGAHAIAKMDWIIASVTFTSLVISGYLLALSLVSFMVPGSRQLMRPLWLGIAVLLGLAVVFAAIFSYSPETAFGLRAWRCLRTGLPGGALAAIPIWLILRKGAVLDARTCGAFAGMLAGLTGTALLEIHCPDFNIAHILAGHWTAALLGAGIGWLAGGIAARRD